MPSLFHLLQIKLFNQRWTVQKSLWDSWQFCLWTHHRAALSHYLTFWNYLEQFRHWNFTFRWKRINSLQCSRAVVILQDILGFHFVKSSAFSRTNSKNSEPSFFSTKILRFHIILQHVGSSNNFSLTLYYTNRRKHNLKEICSWWKQNSDLIYVPS